MLELVIFDDLTICLFTLPWIRPEGPFFLQDSPACQPALPWCQEALATATICYYIKVFNKWLMYSSIVQDYAVELLTLTKTLLINCSIHSFLLSYLRIILACVGTSYQNIRVSLLGSAGKAFITRSCVSHH